MIGPKGEYLGVAMLLVYVDDILVSSSSLRVEETIIKAISQVVPTKVTGHILPSHEGGGKITFIGRELQRHPGEKEIVVAVNPSYLEPCFSDFSIDKGTLATPDVAAHLEKQDAVSRKPLSPEGYHKFRKALGKLIWLSQSRGDLKLWLSLIGTQQSCPTQSTEAALRSVLRYLFWDRYTVLILPSREYGQIALEDQDSMVTFIHGFSDASHGPYRFNKRKGFSGGILMIEGGLIRCVAKQQQATALSSCEAELYAIQGMSQDAVSMTHVIHRVLFGLGEIDAPEPLRVVMESDSNSALQLIGGLDLPKKSRHVEIRLGWLREQIGSQRIQLRFHPGSTNVADLFTKCLGTRDFLRHRSVIGFVQLEGPVNELMALTHSFHVSAPADEHVVGVRKGVNVTLKVLFVEVCCEKMSSLRQGCEKLGFGYIGVFSDMERIGVMRKVRSLVLDREAKGYHVHVHVSTPCKTGSPLCHFREKTAFDENEWKEWKQIMSCALSYLQLGHSKSFELPLYNNIWGRKETVKVLEESSIIFNSHVHLCRCGYVGRHGQPVSKVLRFSSDSETFCKALTERFGHCRCEGEHAPFSDVDYTKSALYSPVLAKGLLVAVRKTALSLAT